MLNWVIVNLVHETEGVIETAFPYLPISEGVLPAHVGSSV